MITSILDPSKATLNDKIFKVNLLLKQARDGLSKSFESIEDRKTNLMTIWQQLLDTFKSNPELNHFDLVFTTMKTQGDINLDFKDLIEALKVYRNTKIYCEDY
jgi:ACT domain-containing protein